MHLTFYSRHITFLLFPFENNRIMNYQLVPSFKILSETKFLKTLCNKILIIQIIHYEIN